MVVNLDKEEFIHPHRLGSGLKMWEIAANGIPSLLTYLLGHSTGRGGGDPRGELAESEWGRWAGDRIVITGDYDEDSREEDGRNLYDRVQDEGRWTEISDEVVEPFNEFIDLDDHQLEIRDHPNF